MATCIHCGRHAEVGLLCLTCADPDLAADRARLAHIPQRLYDSEINFTVRAFFDAGFEWELWGRTDQDPGVDGHADTYEGAMRQMADAAARLAPESEFARWWRE